MTTLCSIPISSPLLNASGCYSSTLSQIQELDQIPSCGAIVSKSCTIQPQFGNPHPRFYQDDKVCINSMGLPNFGHNYYSNITTNKLYIQSVYPKTINDLDVLFNTKSMVIEVNMSCPNVNYKLDNYEECLDKIKLIKNNKIVGLKMSPIFDIQGYDIMSNLILKYDIDYIVCSNNIGNCLVVDWEKEETVIHPNFGLGGMSMKSVSLANVYNFSRRLGNRCDVVGCGGIESGRDAFEYILCGAKCVSIGSCLLKEGIGCFGRIEWELLEIMRNKGYRDVGEFCGMVKNCGSDL
jgi:dihydroorotate dehydrogenase (fumarate)